MKGPHLALRSATRRFGELVAVRQLDIELAPGTLHAIVGENGAGKSTALKMLAGHLTPSAGQVVIDGAPMRAFSPQEAIVLGIGMVHQHFMLIDTFSALENLVLGHEPVASFGRLRLDEARAKAQAICAATGLTLDLEQPVATLSVGQRQRLEILRVLYRGARALLLDEPTAVLAPLEAADLYKTLRAFAADGGTVAIVTHRVDEVVRHCDYVTVMRRGQSVLSRPLQHGPEPSAEARRELTQAIMGSQRGSRLPLPALPSDAAVVLSADALTALKPDGRLALDGLSLEVRRGEVLGVAGIEGNGQRELVRALSGLCTLDAGRVSLQGKQLFPGPVAENAAAAIGRAREAGLVTVLEDRHRDELLLDTTVADNLVLGDLERGDEQALISRRMARFDISPANPSNRARTLSGGNQQKLIVARALDRPTVALLLAHPTRGVDLAASAAIGNAIVEAAGAGAAVLLISADLNELRSLSHRIVVLRRGKLVATFSPDSNNEQIGSAMLDGSTEGAA